MTKEMIKNGYNRVHNATFCAAVHTADAALKAADFLINEVRQTPTRDLLMFGVVGGPLKRRATQYLVNKVADQAVEQPQG